MLDKKLFFKYLDRLLGDSRINFTNIVAFKETDDLNFDVLFNTQHILHVETKRQPDRILDIVGDIYDVHPMRSLRKHPNYQVMFNTLSGKKHPTATVALNGDLPKRFPFQLAQEIFLHNQSPLEVTWSKREAFISNCEYLDYIHYVFEDRTEGD